MNPFTLAVYQYMAAEPVDVQRIIREWMLCERVPERRAVAFAGQLDRNFKELAAALTDPLLHEWILLAAERVNWRRVADKLLERFGPRLPASVPAPSRN